MRPRRERGRPGIAHPDDAGARGEATTLLSGAATTALALVLTAPATGHVDGASRTEPYTNPVSAGFADTFADPAVIRGKDGYWYAYGTTDPLREGEGTRHLLPVSRGRPGRLGVRR